MEGRIKKMKVVDLPHFSRHGMKDEEDKVVVKV
jgi:hypothetical protein